MVGEEEEEESNCIALARLLSGGYFGRNFGLEEFVRLFVLDLIITIALQIYFL